MFKLEEFKNKRILKSTLIDEIKVTAFFTTKDLALKAGERTDLETLIESNKELVCKELGIQNSNLVIPQQTHSDNVGIVENLSDTIFENTDALITNKKNIALGLNFADCTPLIFYDPINNAIGSAHAGWRGTVAKIGVKTIEQMQKNYGTNPKDVIALVGPCIGECCFEVKDDVKEKILNSVDSAEHNSICKKNHIDLKLVNRLQLLAIGVKKIDVCEYCTSCKNELFFSYRRENGYTARHSSVIMLK